MVEYKWLFDGVGGTVALAAIAGLWRLLRTPRNVPAVSARVPAARPPVAATQPSAVASRTMPEIVDISFAEINRAIKDAPPLHQEEVARRYQGFRVKWVTALYSATRHGDDIVSLDLDAHPDHVWTVQCEVLRSEYPQLSILHRGTAITVQGCIAEVYSALIRLDEVKLSFPPRVEPTSAAAEPVSQVASPTAERPTTATGRRRRSGPSASPMLIPQAGSEADAGPLEGISIPDLRAVTMSEAGTKIDLAKAYMDMSDSEGARSLLTEVLGEGTQEQKREARQLIDQLPK